MRADSFPCGPPAAAGAGASGAPLRSAIWRAYHLHAGTRAIIARAASIANLATPACSRTNSAASSGPSEKPHEPPTWKMDCASPRLLPAASDVMRDASGCIIDEPIPEMKTAPISECTLPATDMSISPVMVHSMPSGKNHPACRLSNMYPKIGCIIEAEIWYVNATSPISP